MNPFRNQVRGIESIRRAVSDDAKTWAAAAAAAAAVPDDDSPSNSTPHRPPSRRGFLKGIGATGVAVAAVMFGASEARAGNYNCCNLLYPLEPYNACRSAPCFTNYIWTCGGYDWFGQTCYCCEDWQCHRSAYSCN